MVLHLRLVAPGNWARARCRDTAYRDEDGTVTDPFFEGPEDDAVAFCRDGCPLIGECLLFALVNNERAGVWGGTTTMERRAIRKRWKFRRGGEPHPAWRVFAPGEPLDWFTPADLTEEEDEEEEDDEP